MNTIKNAALAYHLGTRPGKIEVTPTKPCRTQRDLSLAYTPGVAEPYLTRNCQKPIDKVRLVVNGGGAETIGSILMGMSKPCMCCIAEPKSKKS
jgi:malate dehydrogenase (oxaloacetate-decarboxylating)(NADP+)